MGNHHFGQSCIFLAFNGKPTLYEKLASKLSTSMWICPVL